MKSTRIVNFQEKQSEITDFLHAYFRPNVPVISSAVNSLHEQSRKALLRKACRLLGRPAVKREDIRIAASKVLVALLPDSLAILQRLLKNFENDHDYEIQFTLFCYLDEALLSADASSIVDRISDFLREYLRSVPTGKAHAAWMAGDLVGDHWGVTDALRILLDSAISARFSAGRQAAIAGLSKLCEKVTIDEQENIKRLLRKIMMTDRSSSARVAAKLALRNAKNQS